MKYQKGKLELPCMHELISASIHKLMIHNYKALNRDKMKSIEKQRRSPIYLFVSLFQLYSYVVNEPFRNYVTTQKWRKCGGSLCREPLVVIG